MKIMISQPMNGRNDHVVKNERDEIFFAFEKAGIEVIYTLFDFDMTDKRYTHPELQYLSASINAIGQVDAVYFAPGWEKARGCRIERKICEDYGVTILDTIPEPKKEEETHND